MVLGDVRRRPRPLDFPEVGAEGELLLVGDVLPVKHEDRVLVHAGVNRRGLLGGQRAPQVDPFDLAHEYRMNLADTDRHRLSSNP